MHSSASLSSSACAICISRTKAFLTAIIEKACEALASYAQFVSWKDAETETELRAVVSWPGDERRLAELNAFFLHTPTRNRIRTVPFRLPSASAQTDLVAKYFRGLGDPTRLRILELLRDEEELTSANWSSDSGSPSRRSPVISPVSAGAASSTAAVTAASSPTGSPISEWPS